MPFLALVAAASFVCANPAAIDGQTLGCAGREAAIVLEGLGARKISVACDTGVDCAGKEAIVLRDRLRALVDDRDIVCFAPKSKGAPMGAARCFADGVDLSCSMIFAAGMQPNGAPLDCVRPTTISQKLGLGGGSTEFAMLPAHVIPAKMQPAIGYGVPLYLLLINILAYVVFANNRRRVVTATSRVSQGNLLLLTVFGGGPGAIYGHYRLGHLDGQPFTDRLALVVGLQIAFVAGLGIWLYLPSLR